MTKRTFDAFDFRDAPPEVTPEAYVRLNRAFRPSLVSVGPIPFEYQFSQGKVLRRRSPDAFLFNKEFPILSVMDVVSFAYLCPDCVKFTEPPVRMPKKLVPHECKWRLVFPNWIMQTYTEKKVLTIDLTQKLMIDLQKKFNIDASNITQIFEDTMFCSGCKKLQDFRDTTLELLLANLQTKLRQPSDESLIEKVRIPLRLYA